MHINKSVHKWDRVRLEFSKGDKIALVNANWRFPLFSETKTMGAAHCVCAISMMSYASIFSALVFSETIVFWTGAVYSGMYQLSTCSQRFNLKSCSIYGSEVVAPHALGFWEHAGEQLSVRLTFRWYFEFFHQSTSDSVVSFRCMHTFWRACKSSSADGF